MPEYLRAALREKISTFHQLPNELFWQVWQRFDGYRRTRPHHGYSDVQLLQFFYYGVRRYFQVELDVAGFWDLCAEYTQGAYSLCDNMAFRSHDNPIAELEAQIHYLKEEANKRRYAGFQTVEQEQINRSSFQESIYCDTYYDQAQAPSPQYQIPTPQPSKSQTTIEEINAMFCNWNLEATKIMDEIKEITVATSITSDSKLITSDTQMKMVGNQVDEEVEVTERQHETLPMCTIVEDEKEEIGSEFAILGAEFSEEINLQHLPECADTLAEDLIAAECVETFEWDLGAAENEVVTPDFVEETSPIDAAPSPPSEQEEVTAFDQGTQPDQQGKELEDAQRFELFMETEDMSLAATCHDSLSAETVDFSLAATEDISAIESQTCAEDILESAAMPRTGPDKPEDHTVSQFDRIVHHDIRDSLAHIWSMSKKGNGFPWDDGISRELKLSDDPGLDRRNFWVSNLLKPPLMFDHKSSGFLIKDGGKPAGIPRTGPDIQGFYEFDLSQFLRFAGEGGRITYCDVIGSVTRPPEILLNVPVLC